MYGTDWPTVQSTCPPLKLYLTFEQGTRVQAQPYDLTGHVIVSDTRILDYSIFIRR